MGVGGEMEGWRNGIRAEALRGLGRTEEAVEVAHGAVDAALGRGIEWGGTLAMHALARALAANGELEQAERTAEEALAIAHQNRATVTARMLEADREAFALEAR